MTLTQKLEMKRRTRRLLELDLDTALHSLRDDISRFEKYEPSAESNALLQAWRKEILDKLNVKLRIIDGKATDMEIREALTRRTDPVRILGGGRGLGQREYATLWPQGDERGDYESR